MRNDGKSDRNAPDIGQLDEVDRAALMSMANAAGIKDLSCFAERDTTARALRLYMTAFYYRAQTERVNKLAPIRYRPQGFARPLPLLSTPPVSIPEMHFYLVIGANPLAYAACALAKQRDVLVSYFHIKTFSHNKGLRDYLYDPLGAAERFPAFAKYTTLLKEHIHHEG